jgi:endonuclease YncB( thermonuclease family)
MRKRKDDNVVQFSPWRRPQKKSARRSNWPRRRRRRRVPYWLKKLIVGAAIVLALLGYQAWDRYSTAETFEAKVTHVRDGDTIEVGGYAIRLNGLNCDELGSPLGEKAKREMQNLVSGKVLQCNLDGGTTYDRESGRCYLDGRDIAISMIENRSCGRCDAYDPFFTYALAQWRAGPFPGGFPRYCQLF